MVTRYVWHLGTLRNESVVPSISTTCGFFMTTVKNRVLFSTTHMSPPPEKREVKYSSLFRLHGTSFKTSGPMLLDYQYENVYKFFYYNAH